MDVRTGAKSSSIVYEISSGSSFGELALVQECVRTATFICNGECIKGDKMLNAYWRTTCRLWNFEKESQSKNSETKMLKQCLASVNQIKLNIRFRTAAFGTLFHKTKDD